MLHIAYTLSSEKEYTGPLVSSSTAANALGYFLSGSYHLSSTLHVRTLATLKSHLLLAANLQKITTYPMVNDVYGMGLLTRAAAATHAADATVDASLVKTLKGDLQALAQDNVKLMGENEELHRLIYSTQMVITS